MAFTRVLRIGDKGNDVRLVQQALGIKVDGDFGRATKTAVEEFQKNNGLTVDGVVGSITWEALGLNNPTISLAPKTPQSINQIRLEAHRIRMNTRNKPTLSLTINFKLSRSSLNQISTAASTSLKVEQLVRGCSMKCALEDV